MEAARSPQTLPTACHINTKHLNTKYYLKNKKDSAIRKTYSETEGLYRQSVKVCTAFRQLKTGARKKFL